MKNFLKKLTGLDKEEQKIAEEMELIKKKDPKEYATRRKEPWVSVLDVKVNQENVRNGFFELDWNEYFIKDLLKAGYGEEADPGLFRVGRGAEGTRLHRVARRGADAGALKKRANDPMTE